MPVLRTFQDMISDRSIVALAPYIDGQLLIVATEHDLFEIDIVKRGVTLLRFWNSPYHKDARSAFAELVTDPIVAVTVLFPGRSVHVATSKNIFEVNLETGQMDLLKFWPTNPSGWFWRQGEEA